MAGLLALLPPDAPTVIFVRPQSVLQRPSVAWQIDNAISLLSRRTDGVLSEQMLAAAGIDRAAFVSTADYIGAAILSGDFSAAIELLRQAPVTSEGIRDFDPPSALEPYRGVEVFFFPYYYDLYISVPDDATMLLSQSDTLMKELIDRYLDETTLDESLAHLLDTTGPMDFLVARRLDAEDAAQNGQSSGSPFLYAGGGWLDEDDSSSVFTYTQFASSDDAKQAMKEWEEWPLVQGYNSGKNHPGQELRQAGSAIIRLGVAPNIDLGGWLLGN